MARFITILLLSLFCNLSKGQSNKYHPFTFPNSQWNELTYAMPDPPSYCELFYKYSLFISKDTIISAQNYYKIYKSGTSSATCQYTTQPYENIYVGAIRQDSLHKKVFFVPPGNSKDTLLYDFNLNIGDTLPQSYNNIKSNTYVLKIDSVLVGMSYHKRFVLGFKYHQEPQNDTLAIIEGIGSTYGLYNIMFYPSEYGTNLSCFRSENKTYPASTTCNTVLGINSSQKLSASIFPNPSNSKFTIQTENSLINANLTITDGLGTIVYQLNNISGQSLTIQPNLTNGIYILRLQTGDKEYIEKLIMY